MLLWCYISLSIKGYLTCFLLPWWYSYRYIFCVFIMQLDLKDTCCYTLILSSGSQLQFHAPKEFHIFLKCLIQLFIYEALHFKLYRSAGARAAFFFGLNSLYWPDVPTYSLVPFYWECTLMCIMWVSVILGALLRTLQYIGHLIKFTYQGFHLRNPKNIPRNLVRKEDLCMRIVSSPSQCTECYLN